MMFNWKFLLATTAMTALFVSCSNETAVTEPSIPTSEHSSSIIKEPEIKNTEAASKKAAEQAQKQKEMIKEQAMRKAESEAVAAQEKAKLLAEKKAHAAKEARLRAEADAKAAKEAEQAEAQRRRAQERAAMEQQRIKEAQAQAQAQATREAQIAKDAQIRENQLAQVARDTHQAASAPIIAEPVAPANINPNAPYNAFLSKYVSSVNGINLVAYDKVTPADRAQLQAYIEKLSTMDIEALPRDAEMATWFNLYNAKTIDLILENYPTKSIRKISNPWKRKRLVVNGKKMSLDDIEHGTVRRKYNEPRVHYAFNCASIGCPNVKRSAWEASTLEADLAQASRDFIASDRGVAVRDGKIIASSIFKWYKKDFGGNEAGILAHLRQYASGSKKAALEAKNNINKYDYDWDLNIR